MTTLHSLLNPGYEPGDGTMDGAQLVDGQWWHPVFGSDSLQYVVDNARQALAPEVAMTPSEAAQQILQHANAAGLSPKDWADKFNKFNPKLHTQRGPMTFMSDQLLPIPAGSTVRQNVDGSWQYRSKPGPWCDMPAPQKAVPWSMPTPPKPPATVAPTLCDRIARALCVAMWPDRDSDGPRPCSTPCATCRDGAAAAAHEIADHFSELYGGARTTADTLYAVGTHQHAPPAGWQPIDPGQRDMALAVGRELRRHDA